MKAEGGRRGGAPPSAGGSGAYPHGGLCQPLVRVAPTAACAHVRGSCRAMDAIPWRLRGRLPAFATPPCPSTRSCCPPLVDVLPCLCTCDAPFRCRSATAGCGGVRRREPVRLTHRGDQEGTGARAPPCPPLDLSAEHFLPPGVAMAGVDAPLGAPGVVTATAVRQAWVRRPHGHPVSPPPHAPHPPPHWGKAAEAPCGGPGLVAPPGWAADVTTPVPHVRGSTAGSRCGRRRQPKRRRRRRRRRQRRQR